MKTNLFFRKILWMIFLTGCVSTPSPTEDAKNNLTAPATSISPAPTIMITITPFPPELVTPSLQEEKEAIIKDLMKTNSGCRLPCFWGIMPGVTTWETAETFLQTIGATIGNIETSPGINYHSVIFENETLTTGDSFGFYETMGIVDSILASGNLYGSTRNVEDFVFLWNSYAPREIVNQYGIPSRVLLSSVFAIGYGNTGRQGYILWIFYDHLGFMIRYDGTVADLPVYHICPQFQEDGNITRIDLALQDPLDTSPLEIHDSILTNSTVPRIILPIEDAARINMEEFYNLFARENNQPCFDTPRDVWKTE